MDMDRLRLILRAIVQAQFGYCSLIWMFHDDYMSEKFGNEFRNGSALRYIKDNQDIHKVLPHTLGQYEMIT